MDQDALLAAAALVGRTGARNLEIGYLHDDVPVHEAGWYAHAQYKGTRVIEEDHRGPIEAVEALARRLLDGGQCAHCKQTVTLTDGGGCRWTRMGRQWRRGCADRLPEGKGPNRAQRRAMAKKAGLL